MGRDLIKFNPVDSHTSKNLNSSYPDDTRIRSERRWRRREAVIDSLKHNRFTSATKTTAKICGNTSALTDKNYHMIDDDADEDYVKKLSMYTSEDYGSFLPTHDPDIQTDCASYHSGGSNGNNIHSDEIDADYASYLATLSPGIEIDCASNHSGGSNGNNTHSDEVDADYASYLATLNPGIEIDCASNHSGGSNDNDFETDEMDADYASYLATLNPGIETDCTSNHSGDSNGNNSECDEMDADYTSFLASLNPGTETDCTSNHSGDSNGNNSVSDETETDYASYLATLNLDIENECDSSHSGGSNINMNNDEVDADYGNFLPSNDPNIETDRASNHSGGSLLADVDYAQFLNSVTIVDDDKEYFRDKNTTNTSNVADESNSSDSDLIMLECYPICGNTPFVSSKAYDSSCFGEEMNPEYNKKIAAYGHSEFRRRLMECLDKPYDQEEYDELLLKASNRTKKERHLETRQGVVKSYQSEGLSKSYLDTYPDLVEAIAEFKGQHRVLFLLRGFFFWVEKVSLAGRFQPWRDESCLEIMRKM